MFICIEGNIGAGKTTLAKALSEELKAVFLPERFEENTLLPLFYENKKTFAFPTEYSFLIDRQKQLTHFFDSILEKQITVSDFHFDKCLCYAQANLSANDFLFYQKHFKAIQKTIKQPDLVVYLNTTTDLLKINIQKRGREMEKDLNERYLIKLKKSLDNYYLKNQKNNNLVLPLLIDEYNNATTLKCITEIKNAINL